MTAPWMSVCKFEVFHSRPKWWVDRNQIDLIIHRAMPQVWLKHANWFLKFSEVKIVWWAKMKSKNIWMTLMAWLLVIHPASLQVFHTLAERWCWSCIVILCGDRLNLVLTVICESRRLTFNYSFRLLYELISALQ